MTDTIATEITAETETVKGKRGRKAMTFEDMVAAQPTEIDHAWTTHLADTFGITVDPKAVRLLNMNSVRNTFHNSDEYKAAVAARNARVDAAKLAQVTVSVDAMLAKLSPEQIAALKAQLGV